MKDYPNPNKQKTIKIEKIIDLFTNWFNQAQKHPNIEGHNAMNIATADASGIVSNRMVLLKDYGIDGFIFYTNLQSQKAKALLSNPNTALCFFWQPLGKQIRITGKAHLVDDKTADQYFNTRDWRSKLGATISQQSQPLTSYKKLQLEFGQKAIQMATKPIERPKYWSGFCVVPEYFEFWQQMNFRIHKRKVFKKQNNQWTKFYLYP